MPIFMVWGRGEQVGITTNVFYHVFPIQMYWKYRKMAIFCSFRAKKVLKCHKTQNNNPCGQILSLTDTLEQFLIFGKIFIGPSGA